MRNGRNTKWEILNFKEEQMGATMNITKKNKKPWLLQLISFTHIFHFLAMYIRRARINVRIIQFCSHIILISIERKHIFSDLAALIEK